MTNLGPAGPGPSVGRWRSWLWLAPVLVAALVLQLAGIDQGWYPHDEGALGQSAERVLTGQVPHRDFDELYTGLLTYLHAMAFRVAGVEPVVLRIPVLIGALVWLAALYRIALRFVPGAGAAALCLLALSWSVPAYPAAMPSWYNLFCATFGLLALVRWLEERRAVWLVLAGVAGGVSILFKLHGVLFLAGAALFLVWSSAPRVGGTRTRGLAGAQVLLSAALLVPMVVYWRLVGFEGDREFLRFAVAPTLLIAALLVREWRGGGMTGAERLARLARPAILLAAGAAIPLLVFAGAMASAGGLEDLLQGVLVTPFRRLESATYRPPVLRAALWGLPLLWLLWPRPPAGPVNGRRVGALLAMLLGLVLVLSATHFVVYRVVWWSAWSLPMVVAVITAWHITRAGAGTDPGDRKPTAPAVLIGTVAVFAMLVEFPFAAPVYTLFALPLAFLAAAAVRPAGAAGPVQAVVLAFFLLFGLLRVVPGTVDSLGLGYRASDELARLDLPRGGLRIRPAEANTYEALIPAVVHLANGRPIWAGPDAPEVYFLSGLPNRTRTLVDAFNRDPDPPGGLAPRLEALGVGVVVLKLESGFSPPLTAADLAGIAAGWPHARGFEGFEVRWR